MNDSGQAASFVLTASASRPYRFQLAPMIQTDIIVPNAKSDAANAVMIVPFKCWPEVDASVDSLWKMRICSINVLWCLVPTLFHPVNSKMDHRRKGAARRVKLTLDFRSEAS